MVRPDDDDFNRLGMIDEEEAMPLRPQTVNIVNSTAPGAAITTLFGNSEEFVHSEVRERLSLRDDEMDDTGLAELVYGIR